MGIVCVESFRCTQHYHFTNGLTRYFLWNNLPHMATKKKPVMEARNIRLPNPVWEKLKKLADAQHWSVALYIRLLIEDHIDGK